jgi:hypothetical protein
MDTSEKKYDFESFLSVLLDEVIKSDMTMQDRQMEAWKQFAELRPRGELINDDIDVGWAQQRYLTFEEVRFKFNVRLVPQNFFRRMRQGIRYIFGKYNPQAFYSPGFVISEAENPDSIEVTVIIKQEEKGKIKISYEPVDAHTKKFFMNSPFLQKLK